MQIFHFLEKNSRFWKSFTKKKRPFSTKNRDFSEIFHVLGWKMWMDFFFGWQLWVRRRVEKNVGWMLTFCLFVFLFCRIWISQWVGSQSGRVGSVRPGDPLAVQRGRERVRRFPQHQMVPRRPADLRLQRTGQSGAVGRIPVQSVSCFSFLYIPSSWFRWSRIQSAKWSCFHRSAANKLWFIRRKQFRSHDFQPELNVSTDFSDLMKYPHSG